MDNHQVARDILSDITVNMKYSRFLPEKQRRESWDELVTRNMNMHIDKFPNLEEEIKRNYQFVFDKKVLPSMRSLQFGGLAIETSPMRIYNCSFLHIDNYKAFSEVMLLLLMGVGVGYSVQTHHVEKLPPIVRPNKERRFLIEDSIQGWAESVNVLMKSYFFGKSKPRFDFSQIRPKGAKLVTSGGKAPGAEPLKTALFQIEKILDRKQTGEQLTTLETHDILCMDYNSLVLTEDGWEKIGDLVLSKSTKNVLSFNEVTNKYEYKSIYGWHENSHDGVFYKLNLEGAREGKWGQLHGKFTDNHPILTSNGYKQIKDLVSGDLINIGEYSTDETLDSVVVGTLLGDASAIKQGTTHIQFSHSEPQVDYLLWKKSFFENRGFSSKNIIKRERTETNLSSNAETIYTFNSTSAYTFNKYYNELYLDGKKTLTQEFVNRITPLSLAVWYMDDGSNHFCKGGWDYPYNYVTLSTQSFSFEENEVLVSVLNKFGVESKIDTISYVYNNEDKTKYRLRLDKNNSEKFFNLVSKYIPESMQYKLPERFRSNYDFTDIVNLTPEYLKLLSVEETNSRVPTKKYCIDVKDNHNFKTLSGIVHNCHIADAVLSGGIRRAAMISIFSLDDDDMLGCKFGNWWELNPQRARANNSAMILRHKVKKEDFLSLWKKVELSGSGEPGFVFSNNSEWGFNPCAEVSLRTNQFCNLTTINASNIIDQSDLEERTKAATFIATLQASYTDFYYLRDVWKRTTEKEALIGVSMTGIASGHVLSLDIEAASKLVLKENERVSNLLGINKAARTTVIKPEGTASLVVGSSSGVHAWHDEYYIRRIRINKNEPMYAFLSLYHPELLQDEVFSPNTTAVIEIPQKAPIGAITRKDESAISLLERVKDLHTRWIKPGHRKGDNTNNVSATITIKPDEWLETGEWLWLNKDSYTALSFLPYSDHTYVQAPFETITEEKYNEMVSKLVSIDLSLLVEIEDATTLADNLACYNGACEVV